MQMETLTYNFPVFIFFFCTHCSAINRYTRISHCSLSNIELKLFLTSVHNVNKSKTLCPHNDIQLFFETHVNLQAVIQWSTLTENSFAIKIGI